MQPQEEISYLESLKRQPLPKRLAGYARFSGPGFFQSAMTLGGGTAGACFVAGSAFGYQLLWVQPLAMVLGVVVLAAIARQTLHSQERTYRVFQKRLHPSLALLWAISALLATVIWHFPQYGLATNAVVTSAQQFGLYPSPWLVAIVILLGVTAISWAYEAGAQGIRLYEWVIKAMVWGCVLIFGFVAFQTGIRWDEVWRGFFTFQIPDDPRAVTTIIGALGAAVGINMIFLYPYSLLRKGWKEAHTGPAFFDLMAGMFVPYVLATTFIIIGTANTVYHAGGKADGLMDLLPVLTQYMSPEWAAILLGAGLFAIGVSTITVHMLAAGFILCEIFGFPHKGWPYRLFMLVPAVGVLGATTPSPFWAAILASSFAVIFLPVTNACFLILLNNKSYMGRARPRGALAWSWNTLLGLSILVMSVASFISYRDRIGGFLAAFFEG